MILLLLFGIHACFALNTLPVRVTQLVDNYYDVAYTTAIQLGTPPQTFSVLVDTGSPYLWVYNDASSQATVRGVNRFKSSLSSSFRTSGTYWEVTYGSGWAEGEQITETLGFGNVTVTGVTCYLASAWDPAFDNDPLMGIIGLSPTINVDPLAKIFSSSGAELIFSFLFDDIGDNALMVLGEPFGNSTIVYLPLVASDSWSVALAQVTIGTTTLLGASATALFDTGTSFLGLPYSVYEQIYAYIHNVRSDCTLDSSNFIQCTASGTSHLPSLTFYFSGIDVLLTPVQYMYGNTVGFQQLDPSFGSMFILGDTYLQNAYTIFNIANASVGISNSNPAMSNLTTTYCCDYASSPSSDSWSTGVIMSVVFGVVGCILIGIGIWICLNSRVIAYQDVRSIN